MKTDDTLTPPRSWINVAVIALVARILCCELVLQNEYLKAENRILKSKVSKRLSFTDDERRTLVDAISYENSSGNQRYCFAFFLPSS